MSHAPIRLKDWEGDQEMNLYDKTAWYADGRLLAAAPEMLAELKRIEQDLTDREGRARSREHICCDIRMVIARAEGTLP
jgi:hypothetical protein